MTENIVCSNLQDRRWKRGFRFQSEDLVPTADIKKTFSKGDSTIWSYNLYTVTEAMNDKIHSYEIKYLLERYNENYLRPTKPYLDENNQVMKKLKLIHWKQGSENGTNQK